YGFLRPGSGERPLADEILADEMERVVSVISDAGARIMFSKMCEAGEYLSRSDKDYLAEAFGQYGQMGFIDLRDISRRESAYLGAAPGGVSLNSEMDLAVWLKEICHSEDEEREMIEELGSRADDSAKVEPLQSLV